MFKLFDEPYLPKAYQPTAEQFEEAEAENEWVNLQKDWAQRSGVFENAPENQGGDVCRLTA